MATSATTNPKIVCDGCTKRFTPTRPPRANRRSFCPACQAAGIPTRVRQRAWRAAKAPDLEPLGGWPAEGFAVISVNTGVEQRRYPVRLERRRSGRILSLTEALDAVGSAIQHGAFAQAVIDEPAEAVAGS